MVLLVSPKSEAVHRGSRGGSGPPRHSSPHERPVFGNRFARNGAGLSHRPARRGRSAPFRSGGNVDLSRAGHTAREPTFACAEASPRSELRPTPKVRGTAPPLRRLPAVEPLTSGLKELELGFLEGNRVGGQERGYEGESRGTQDAKRPVIVAGLADGGRQSGGPRRAGRSDDLGLPSLLPNGPPRDAAAAPRLDSAWQCGRAEANSEKWLRPTGKKAGRMQLRPRACCPITGAILAFGGKSRSSCHRSG